MIHNLTQRNYPGEFECLHTDTAITFFLFIFLWGPVSARDPRVRTSALSAVRLLTMSGGVSLTKITHQQPRSSSSSNLSSVTVRPGKTSSFTPLATYLQAASRQPPDRASIPSIEIITNNEDSNELPPGTKIITHPMINNSRAWDTKVLSRK